jgi:hypothetical protein
MDIKHFAILEWVERDLLILKTISTSDNAADGFTKSLTKQLFYCHFDTYMGRRVQSYVHKRGNRDLEMTIIFYIICVRIQRTRTSGHITESLAKSVLTSEKKEKKETKLHNDYHSKKDCMDSRERIDE